MLNLIISLALAGVLFSLAYGLYRITPVRRTTRKFARRNRDLLLTAGFALLAAAVMYLVVFPIMCK